MNKTTFDASLTEFLDNHGKSLLRIANALTGSSHSGEDLFQAGLVKCYPKLRKINQSAWYSYFRQTIVNTHINDWRKQSKVEQVDSDFSENLESPSTDLGEILDIRQALYKLPKHHRATVSLRYVLGFSIEETAQLLKTNQMQVKNWSRAGLAELRQSISSIGEKAEISDER